MQGRHRQTQLVGAGDNMQPGQHQSSSETERSSGTHCSAGVIQDLLGKKELGVERRRAHRSELRVNENFRSSYLFSSVSTSDIINYLLVRLEA